MVGHAGDERADVDERARGGIRRRHRSKQRLDVPVVRQKRRFHNLGVRERRQHLRVRPGLELGRAQFQREQIRRRPRKPEPTREQQVAAELLAGGAQLHALVPRRLREHVLVQVVLDHLGHATHQAEQLLHLLGVARVHQL